MKEIGHEEAFYRRTDYWFLREVDGGLSVKDLCRRHGFSEASYYLLDVTRFSRQFSSSNL